jgi:hypothetical protein
MADEKPKLTAFDLASGLDVTVIHTYQDGVLKSFKALEPGAKLICRPRCPGRGHKERYRQLAEFFKRGGRIANG